MLKFSENNDLIHLNVQYEIESLACFRENHEKPDFSKIAYKTSYTFFFISNSIFHLSLELLRKFRDLRLGSCLAVA